MKTEWSLRSWSGDRTRLTFTPSQPLKSQTQYVIHVGGGMQDQHGHGMGGGHGGGMGAGCVHPTNGSYGMVFYFTTA